MGSTTKGKTVDHRELLEQVYTSELKKLEENDYTPASSALSDAEKGLLKVILDNCEDQKGVLNVLVTSLSHKILFPGQDIRRHQRSMAEGYSGRSIDTRFCTPFMKDKQFPHMKESGWLTRSLEQPYPYDLNYKGKIRSTVMRKTFLKVLDNIESGHKDPNEYLSYLIQLLIVKREREHSELESLIGVPRKMQIDEITHLLETHFDYKYSTQGRARLPVIAIYSLYQSIFDEVSRFKGCRLVPLEEHNSADIRSGLVGDINILDSQGHFFEATEVKYGIKIDAAIIRDCYEKFRLHPVKRYYILSTEDVDKENVVEIKREIANIHSKHGCQVVVNGVLPTIKYYLRLVNDPQIFLERYAQNLKEDSTIHFEHKKAWRTITQPQTSIAEAR